jgi:glutamate racemase
MRPLNKKNPSQAPIGIFDSGVGGLTVAKALRKFLPGESLLYFGDTKHVPYGSKSAETIIRYSLANARFLISQKVKMIVVACNTSTAVALPILQKTFSLPIVGVIIPGASEACQLTPSGKIGVIGTTRTISSKAYDLAIKANNRKAKVIGKACPLLVPLIEEGIRSEVITREIISYYLSDMISKIDTLVLGCTHYPLLKNEIKKCFPKIKLIDSAEATSREVKKILTVKKLLADSQKGKTLITSNDINEVFLRVSARLFPKVPVKSITWSEA